MFLCWSLSAPGMESCTLFQLWSLITTSASVLTYQTALIKRLRCSHSMWDKRAVYLPTASLSKCKVDLPLLPRNCPGLCHSWSNSALPCSLSSDAAQCLAKPVNVCMVWGNELFNTLVPLNDLNVQKFCVINSCNISCAPSRYADTPLEAPLTDWLLSVSELKDIDVDHIGWGLSCLFDV